MLICTTKLWRCRCAELGLHPDRQTVQPARDCLITEILPLHRENQTVRSNQSTAPTLAMGVISHVVPLLRFCALGSGVDFVAQQRVGKIKFSSLDCISARVHAQFSGWPNRVLVMGPISVGVKPSSGIWIWANSRN